MGNAAGGVHAAAQGGLWQAIVFGLAGMRLREDSLAFDPHPPAFWRSLGFPVQWQGRQVNVAADAKAQVADISLERGEMMIVSLGGNGEVQATVTLGKRLRARWLEGAWRPKKKGASDERRIPRT